MVNKKQEQYGCKIYHTTLYYPPPIKKRSLKRRMIGQDPSIFPLTGTILQLLRLKSWKEIIMQVIIIDIQRSNPSLHIYKIPY